MLCWAWGWCFFISTWGLRSLVWYWMCINPITQPECTHSFLLTVAWYSQKEREREIIASGNSVSFTLGLLMDSGHLLHCAWNIESIKQKDTGAPLLHEKLPRADMSIHTHSKTNAAGGVSSCGLLFAIATARFAHIRCSQCFSSGLFHKYTRCYFHLIFGVMRRFTGVTTVKNIKGKNNHYTVLHNFAMTEMWLFWHFHLFIYS